MPNSFDSALVADSIAATTQTVLANRLAPLNLFASDFSSEVKKAKDTIQVPIASATAATQVNPTSFNDIGGSSLGKASVALDHVYQPFGLDYSDILSAHRIERLVKVNVDALADKIWAIATSVITAANFGAATTTRIPTIANGDLGKLWAAVHKASRKGLVVNPTIYSSLIPQNALGLPLQPGAYGFENGVHFASSFSGETGLVGFACAPEAVCVASAVPPLAGDGYMVSDSVVLEQLGLTVSYNIYDDKSARALVASLEVMFGAAPGLTDGTMATVVVSA